MKKLLKNTIQNNINSYYSYFYIQWHVTNLCSENCNHCYIKDRKPTNVFNIKNSIRIINEIYEISLSKKIKPYIAFTGGDPLMHEELFKLMEYAKDKQINISIKGNPRLLDDYTIYKLKQLNIDNYHLSIDGLKKNHDYIRSEGSFDITLNALKKLKDAKIKTIVKYTVSTINYKDIKDVMFLLAEIGVDYFDFARFCPNLKEEYKYTFTAQEYKLFLIDVLKYYQNLKRKGYKIKLLLRDHLWIPLLNEIGIIDSLFVDQIMGEKALFGCSIGNNNCFVINYNGDVIPCAKLSRYILGNVLHESIYDILKSEKFKKLGKLQSYKGCINCKLVSICRGCPAMSESIKGNMFLKDPQCWIKEE